MTSEKMARVVALFLACALLALGVVHKQTVDQLDRARKELHAALVDPRRGLTTTWPSASIQGSCQGAPCTITTGTTATSGYDFWIARPTSRRW